MFGKVSAILGTFGVVALALGVTAGCKKPDGKQRRSAKLMKAAVADFDPTNQDFTINLDKWGSERPDDYDIELAFNQTFDGMDACVADYKQKKGIKPEKQLQGDLEVAVRLNPAKGPPLGVNAKLPKRYEKHDALKECIRTAVAGAPYPKYDGPPIVAEFYTQLDAGSEYWED